LCMDSGLRKLIGFSADALSSALVIVDHFLVAYLPPCPWLTQPRPHKPTVHLLSMDPGFRRDDSSQHLTESAPKIKAMETTACQPLSSARFQG
jgi:hypothetical protein